MKVISLFSIVFLPLFLLPLQLLCEESKVDQEFIYANQLLIRLTNFQDNRYYHEDSLNSEDISVLQLIVIEKKTKLAAGFDIFQLYFTEGQVDNIGRPTGAYVYMSFFPISIYYIPFFKKTETNAFLGLYAGLSYCNWFFNSKTSITEPFIGFQLFDIGFRIGNRIFCDGKLNTKSEVLCLSICISFYSPNLGRR